MGRILFDDTCLLDTLDIQFTKGEPAILSTGGFLESKNRLFFLIMQLDGNLVLYKGCFSVFLRYQGAIWASDTMGSGATEAKMLSDGDFVLYNDNSVVVWNTNTRRLSDYPDRSNRLILQDDGNLVIYGLDKYRTEFAIWSSGTSGLKAEVKANHLRSNSSATPLRSQSRSSQTLTAVERER